MYLFKDLPWLILSSKTGIYIDRNIKLIGTPKQHEDDKKNKTYVIICIAKKHNPTLTL